MIEHPAFVHFYWFPEVQTLIMPEFPMRHELMQVKTRSVYYQVHLDETICKWKTVKLKKER